MTRTTEKCGWKGVKGDSREGEVREGDFNRGRTEGAVREIGGREQSWGGEIYGGWSEGAGQKE